MGAKCRSCLCRQPGLCFLEAWSLGGIGDQWTPSLQTGMYSIRCPRQVGRMARLLRRGFVVSLRGLEPWPRIPSVCQDSQAWNRSRASCLLCRDSLGISAEDLVSGEEWTRLHFPGLCNLECHASPWRKSACPTCSHHYYFPACPGW